MSNSDARIRAVLDSSGEDVLSAYELLQTSEELHLLASQWNWDDGMTEMLLSRIVDDERCDKGTAALIYWNTDGLFAAYSGSDEVPEWARGIFSLCLRIEEKFVKGEFRSCVIGFDPVVHLGSDGVQRCLAETRRNVPSIMVEATPGIDARQRPSVTHPMMVCEFCGSEDGRDVHGGPDYYSLIPGQKMESIWRCFSCAKVYQAVLFDFIKTLDVTQSPKRLSAQVSKARKEVKRLVVEKIRNEKLA